MLMLIVVIALVISTGRAEACIAKVGTANTSVYVRDTQDGDVVGSLEKGDQVIVTGKIKHGYLKVEIGDKEYKIYNEYLDVEETCLDEVKLIGKPRKSKSGGKVATVSGKTTHKIKGSVFDGVRFW